MDCDEAQTLLHGYLDGELDVVHSLALSQHLQGCPVCARAYEAQQHLRDALRGSVPAYALPPPFQRRVHRALRRASRPRPTSWWALWWPQVGVALAALVCLVWVGIGLYRDSALDERVLHSVIAGHVRSLMVQHLTDVTSSDRHTVKPWFEGALDFSPPVPELTAQGFPLIGGRLDYLDQRPVAALVYRRQQHAINLFIWPVAHTAQRQPQHVTRQGFNVVTWTTADLTYWAISTLNISELRTFASAVTAGL